MVSVETQHVQPVDRAFRDRPGNRQVCHSGLGCDMFEVYPAQDWNHLLVSEFMCTSMRSRLSCARFGSVRGAHVRDSGKATKPALRQAVRVTERPVADVKLARSSLGEGTPSSWVKVRDMPCCVHCRATSICSPSLSSGPRRG